MKKIEPNKQTHKQQKKDLSQKLNMFDRLPENCLTCASPFDRKNKEQVQSWFVVVKNAEQKVHLYCPECWNNAQQIAKDFFEKKAGENVSEISNV
jgi:hypothetical protein